LKAVEALDRLKGQGFRTDLASSEAKLESGKSATSTASTVGTSTRKVEKARTVNKDADEETKEAVKKGEKFPKKRFRPSFFCGVKGGPSFFTFFI
jgi:hypothetical protein